MVIWRSLSPSALARVLEMTAAKAAPDRRRVNDTPATAGKPTDAAPEDMAGAKSVPGE